MKIQVLKNESYSDISNLPTRGTLRSTGYDIVATSDPEIVGEKNEFGYSRIDYIQYKTNLKIAVYHSSRHHRDYDVLVMPRSSISKYKLVLANGIGLIDCFSGDSKIKTESGDKTVHDLKIHDIIYSVNSNLEIERDFISAIVSLGEQEILEIETDNGTLEITPGTMVYTDNGIKLASELKENDKLLHF